MAWKSKDQVTSKSTIPQTWAILLCLGSFCSGLLFSNKIWTIPETKSLTRTTATEAEKLKLVSEGCDHKTMSLKEVLDYSAGSHGKNAQSLSTTKELDKSIWLAEMESESSAGFPVSENLISSGTQMKRKYLMVVGINTAFSSRKRRDSIRATWMPQGDNRKRLEDEKGIIIRFVIGHGVTSGGILDKSIDAEHKKHGDILTLDHVEGYMELSAKTRTYFATAVNKWDADFYVKVDDDVHVNIGTLGTTLARHRKKAGIYIGCMKSGPVLNQKGVRYHEPEYWKFGDTGNKYFRHATGQLYAISNDLATYISRNRHVLHKYANEDVSLGAWFIGLDVEHIDDRKLCCGTPPDCEWKAQAGNACVASFDWICSGMCKSVERMSEVHRRCGEGEKALWNATF